MFSEYGNLISELKRQDHHFDKLFEEHNDLDKHIQKLEKKLGHI